MIRAPGVSQAALQSDALVEAVDIYPTLVDLCQTRFKRTAFPFDGKSLRPVLNGANRSVRDAAVSFNGDIVSVRTPTHRLIARSKGGQFNDVELYELSASIDSAENVAEKHPDVTRAMLEHIPEVVGN